VRTSLVATREKYVKWLAETMPGVDEEDGRFVSRELSTRFYTRTSGLDVVGSLAGSAAVAASGAIMAGVPVAGLAVAGVAAGISQSKERRYQAQLAALGGGSLAAGGIGLAAGTALIGSIPQGSGAASAEEGSRLRPRLTKSIAKAESIKLTCLVRALRQHEGRDISASGVAHLYEQKMEEVARALENRSAIGNGTNEDKRRRRLIVNSLKEIRRS